MTNLILKDKLLASIEANFTAGSQLVRTVEEVFSDFSDNRDVELLNIAVKALARTPRLQSSFLKCAKFACLIKIDADSKEISLPKVTNKKWKGKVVVATKAFKELELDSLMEFAKEKKEAVIKPIEGDKKLESLIKSLENAIEEKGGDDKATLLLSMLKDLELSA